MTRGRKKPSKRQRAREKRALSKAFDVPRWHVVYLKAAGVGPPPEGLEEKLNDLSQQGWTIMWVRYIPGQFAIICRRPPLTLADWAKRMDPMGKVPAIIGLLDQANNVLGSPRWP